MKSQTALTGFLALAFPLAALAQGSAPPSTSAAPAGTSTAAAVARTANPELVGMLTSQLGITPKQAEGGSGAVFSYAKEKLKPEDYAKVAKAVPGIDGLISAAPKKDEPQAGGGGTLDTLAGAASQLGGSAGGTVGTVAALAPAFQKLGLSGDTVGKFLPIVVGYVTKKGGTGVGDLLSGVLK